MNSVLGVKRCIQCIGCPEEFAFGKNDSIPCTFGSDTCMVSRYAFFNFNELFKKKIREFKKQTIKYLGGFMISKGCVPASGCKESSISLMGIGYWLNCCTNADNCNSADKINISFIFYTLTILLNSYFQFL